MNNSQSSYDIYHGVQLQALEELHDELRALHPKFTLRQLLTTAAYAAVILALVAVPIVIVWAVILS